MSLRHAILGVLEFQPLHGYALKCVLNQGISNLWPVNLAAIYPCLRRINLSRRAGASSPASGLRRRCRGRKRTDPPPLFRPPRPRAERSGSRSRFCYFSASQGIDVGQGRTAAGSLTFAANSAIESPSVG